MSEEEREERREKRERESENSHVQLRSLSML
jgi:hypothetical protein